MADERLSNSNLRNTISELQMGDQTRNLLVTGDTL